MHIIDAIKEFLVQGLSIVSTFSLETFLLLFTLCLVGEAVGITVPYLFETTLILIGCSFSNGTVHFWELVLLLAATEMGRLLGSYFMYLIGRGGTVLLEKWAKRLKLYSGVRDSWLAKLFGRINLLNPFSVAIGRLLWLRIPLTFILSARRDLKTLLLAVAISTLVYDGAYLIIGAVVGTAFALEPIRILPYLIGGLTVIYLITFAVRRLLAWLSRKRRTADPPSSEK